MTDDDRPKTVEELSRAGVTWEQIGAWVGRSRNAVREAVRYRRQKT